MLQDIEASLEARLYHAALSLALTVPDICHSLSTGNGRAGPEGYAAWFDANMPAYSPSLPGKEAYKVRCGFTHQARAGRDDSRWTRVAFGIGGAPPITTMEGNIAYGVREPDTVIIGLEFFCNAIVHAARRWMEVMADDPVVKRNADHVVRRRGNFSSIVGGFEIIA